MDLAGPSRPSHNDSPEDRRRDTDSWTSLFIPLLLMAGLACLLTGGCGDDGHDYNDHHHHHGCCDTDDDQYPHHYIYQSREVDGGNERGWLLCGGYTDEDDERERRRRRVREDERARLLDGPR